MQVSSCVGWALLCHVTVLYCQVDPTPKPKAKSNEPGKLEVDKKAVEWILHQRVPKRIPTLDRDTKPQVYIYVARRAIIKIQIVS